MRRILGVQETGKARDVAQPHVPRPWRRGLRCPVHRRGRTDVGVASDLGIASVGAELPRDVAELEAKRLAEQDVTLDMNGQHGGGQAEWRSTCAPLIGALIPARRNAARTMCVTAARNSGRIGARPEVNTSGTRKGGLWWCR